MSLKTDDRSDSRSLKCVRNRTEPLALFEQITNCQQAMQSNAHRARLYRDRAEELRTLISEWGDSFSRDALERIALDYDACADRLERDAGLFTAEIRGPFHA